MSKKGPRKCIKTLTRRLTPKYVCPTSQKGGVTSLSTLPVRTERVAELEAAGEVRKPPKQEREEESTPIQQLEKKEKARERLYLDRMAAHPQTMHADEDQEATYKKPDTRHYDEDEEAVEKSLTLDSRFIDRHPYDALYISDGNLNKSLDEKLFISASLVKADPDTAPYSSKVPPSVSSSSSSKDPIEERSGTQVITVKSPKEAESKKFFERSAVKDRSARDFPQKLWKQLSKELEKQGVVVGDLVSSSMVQPRYGMGGGYDSLKFDEKRGKGKMDWHTYMENLKDSDRDLHDQIIEIRSLGQSGFYKRNKSEPGLESPLFSPLDVVPTGAVGRLAGKGGKGLVDRMVNWMSKKGGEKVSAPITRVAAQKLVSEGTEGGARAIQTKIIPIFRDRISGSVQALGQQGTRKMAVQGKRGVEFIAVRMPKPSVTPQNAAQLMVLMTMLAAAKQQLPKLAKPILKEATEKVSEKGTSTLGQKLLVPMAAAAYASTQARPKTDKAEALIVRKPSRERMREVTKKPTKAPKTEVKVASKEDVDLKLEPLMEAQPEPDLALQARARPRARLRGRRAQEHKGRRRRKKGKRRPPPPVIEGEEGMGHPPRQERERGIPSGVAGKAPGGRKHGAKPQRHGESRDRSAERAASRVLEDYYQHIGGEKKKYERLAASMSSYTFSEYKDLWKSKSYVKTFGNQVLQKRMSLKEALNKVPWWMQAELIDYLRRRV